MKDGAIINSLRRVLITTAAVALILFGIATALVRQPVFGRVPFRGAHRADAGALRRHVDFLTAAPRSADHPENLDRAAAYIAEHFRRATHRVSEQVFTARRKTYRNVIAEFGPANGPLTVVGAHYDAFGELPGADDNASGTAGLLELARLLSTAKLDRPVMLVAFTTEEPPFFGQDEMGSAMHANSLRRPVAGMISLEMIGYFTKRQPWQSWVLGAMYPDRGDFIAVTGGWDDRHLTRAVKKAMRASIHTVSFTGPRSMSDASDQRNYWRRGWPAVMVTDTAYLRNPNYHTAGDTAATLDYAKMARVVEGVFNYLVRD